MSASLKPYQDRNISIGCLTFISPYEAVEKDGNGKAQEAIWRLQDEVRGLQEELARTRRALGQREVLLRNAQQRERELRAEAGADAR